MRHPRLLFPAVLLPLALATGCATSQTSTRLRPEQIVTPHATPYDDSSPLRADYLRGFSVGRYYASAWFTKGDQDHAPRIENDEGTDRQAFFTGFFDALTASGMNANYIEKLRRRMRFTAAPANLPTS